MGYYCVPDDVRDVLYPGSSVTPQSGAADLDSEFLIYFIETAQRRVNARLAVRYTVPFPDGAVPDVVHDITRDIAAALADRSNKGQLGYAAGENDPILLLKKDAETMLDQLASGKAELGQPPTDPAADPHEGDAGRAGPVLNRYAESLFTDTPDQIGAFNPYGDRWGYGWGCW